MMGIRDVTPRVSGPELTCDMRKTINSLSLWLVDDRYPLANSYSHAIIEPIGNRFVYCCLIAIN